MGHKIFIGTSGWSYKHWRGIFYPKDLPANKWFEYYCRYFQTVEINNSFYCLPTIKTFKTWYANAPKDFIFSVKGSRFITHMKKLKEPRKSVKKFLTHASYLKEKLGPVLFQLPPHWKVNIERLSTFIKSLSTGIPLGAQVGLPNSFEGRVLPGNLKFVFEFRGNSWFNKRIFELLNKEDQAFCTHDMRGIDCPRLMTDKLAYIRFHGTTQIYGGKYSRKQLKDWASFIRKCAKNGEVYVYFNNDAQGYAIENALMLKKILKE